MAQNKAVDKKLDEVMRKMAKSGSSNGPKFLVHPCSATLTKEQFQTHWEQATG